MAAPSYTTDLATHDAATAAVNFVEPTGMTALDGAGVDDTDLAIYGSQCVSESMRKTGLGALVTNATSRTLPTNGAFFLWFKWFAPNSLDIKSNGGIRVLIGNTSANYRGWYVDGSDTYQYGGWKNYAVDPTKTADAAQTQGTPTTTYAVAGMGVSCPTQSPQKGNSYTIDIIRYGRGQLLITNGDGANGYANFDSAAIVNDNPTTGRWGLFQDQGGSFLWKGLMSLGSAGTSVDFRHSNRAITIDSTEFVDSDFNRIEISNSSSNVEWTNISFTSLSSRARGNLEVIDNATVAFDGCTFTDMGTFIFNGGTNPNTLDANTWRRCQAVWQNGAIIDNCLFSNQIDSAALYASNLNTITNCTFQKSSVSHAVKLGTISSDTSLSWNGNKLSGYTIGSAGTTVGVSGTDSDAIEVNVTTGNTLTLSIVNGSDIPRVQNLGAGTVTITAAVSVTVTGMEDSSEIRIFEAGTTTEIAGAELIVGGVGTGLNNGTAGTSGGKNTFTFSTSASNSVDIIPFNINYNSVPLYAYNVGAGGTVPVTQTSDAVFDNPV